MKYRFHVPLFLFLTCMLAVTCAAPAVPVTVVPTLTVAVPTATVPPPTATMVVPTATQPPPTATVVPPTATPLPPTATDVPSPVPTKTATTAPSPLPSDTPTTLPGPLPTSAVAEPATAQPFATEVKEPGGEHDWEVTTIPWTVIPPKSPTAASASGGGGPLDAVIPPGTGRDLVFNNCTSCHSVVCSLIGQRTRDSWNTVRLGHSDRVPGLSEADQDVLYAYLFENFGDQKPEPDLPPELREQGCSAQ